MLGISRIICKTCRICTKIFVKICENMQKKCEKYAEYALKNARYVKSMGKCDMQQVCTKICKICKICEQTYDMQNMHSPLC